jgi:DNA modification methylase
MRKQGAIFACTSSSKDECLKKRLFGAGKMNEDKALDVKKGDILFLHNKDDNTLLGPYTALCNGKKNIDSKAWRGMYPYQVKVKRYNGKISEMNDFTEKAELLKLDWKNNMINHSQVKILMEILGGNYNESKIKKYLKGLKIQNNEKPILESTTLWDYPKQSYGNTKKGNNKYAGVTPAYIIYNMVKRYTERGDLVIDPMCGSGTTIDVCKEEHRKCIGYDIVPTRPDIIQNDARKIPRKDNTADMVFLDSPYGDNIKYNDSPNNIGHLSAESAEFYESLDEVAAECYRILKQDKAIGWLIGDQWVKKKFTPVSFKIYQILEKYFEPLDIISVARRNQSSNTGIWHNRAIRHNFYLRGHKSLLIFKKTNEKNNKVIKKTKWKYYDR